MAGRLPWILAGGAAIVGGMIFQGSDIVSFDSDREPTVVVRHGDDSADAKESRASIQIVDGRARRGETTEVDPDAIRALTDAVGDLVRAESRLALLKLDNDASKEQLAEAEQQRARAASLVDQLRSEIERNKADIRRDVRASVREQIRDNVRGEVRDAVRSN